MGACRQCGSVIRNRPRYSTICNTCDAKITSDIFKGGGQFLLGGMILSVGFLLLVKGGEFLFSNGKNLLVYGPAALLFFSSLKGNGVNLMSIFVGALLAGAWITSCG